MSVTYRAIGWNAQKRGYDAWIAIGAATYLGLFAAGMLAFHPSATVETIVIRGFGTLAFLLLHLTLSIGPLARLDPRLLPLLYNRRHLGVATFLAGATHGVFSLVQFHAFSSESILTNVLSSSAGWLTVGGFPFQILGLGALIILFAMAATSHDFWLHTLSPRLWKTLHMGVYAAYALLVGHVAFGALQSERHPLLLVSVVAGVVWIVSAHLAAARQEARQDVPRAPSPPSGLIEVCRPGDIADGRARVITIGTERVAVFRYGKFLSALSNVCQHQNGPLGEGRIVRGCVVCPWHGYEYLPDSGASPPPFTEKVETYQVVLRDGRVWVDPAAHPPGTRLEPAVWDEAPEGGAAHGA